MPGQDGYALIRQVRQAAAPAAPQGEAAGLVNGGDGDLPAIALTAFARAEDRAAALAAGFQAHLAKPVEPEELVSLVARLAGREAAAVG